ncbi:MAG: rod shape-determining protein RodA, partial [Deltaproteobacteria bacterium]|nr:rod shape-determining protein RodA [Deltaproteobacteria bacterium]
MERRDLTVKLFSMDRRLMENFSWPLVLSALALSAIGLLNLYSVSLSSGNAASLSEFSKQLAFFLFALSAAFASLFFDYGILKKFALPLYVLGIALLLFVKHFGVTAGGATRWLDFGAFRVQPSELMKPILVVLLAAHFSRKEYAGKNGMTLSTFLLPAAFVLLPFYLILKQPDLGTAGLLGLTAFPIFVAIRSSRGLKIAIAAATAVILAWTFLFGGLGWLVKKKIVRGYQLERVFNHSNPEDDFNGKGWQIIQSKRAIGSGQILGRGFHDGTQQKYGFLPAPDTDFAFAALAEEWGFAGAMTVLALFYVLIRSGLSVVRRSKDNFGKCLVLGLTSLLFWQMLINVAMVTGIFPVVGIPLPFVSYGGSSLSVSVLCVATILNAGMRRYRFQDDPVRENPEVWEERTVIRLREKTPLVRRIGPHDPGEPDIHPVYR